MMKMRHSTKRDEHIYHWEYSSLASLFIIEVELPYEFESVCWSVGLSWLTKRAGSFTSMLLPEHFWFHHLRHFETDCRSSPQAWDWWQWSPSGAFAAECPPEIDCLFCYFKLFNNKVSVYQEFYKDKWLLPKYPIPWKEDDPVCKQTY